MLKAQPPKAQGFQPWVYSEDKEGDLKGRAQPTPHAASALTARIPTIQTVPGVGNPGFGRPSIQLGYPVSIIQIYEVAV